MKYRLVLWLLTAAMFGGCALTRNAYVENTEFDLELPPRLSPASVLRVGAFKNLSGSDRRFMIRGKDGEICASEYLRWRMAPELMLQRCVYGAFTVQAGNDSAEPMLNAVIYCFEFDERDRSAHLGVDFSLTRSGDGRTVRAVVAEPVGDWESGAARAAAMGRCVRRAFSELNGALK